MSRTSCHIINWLWTGQQNNNSLTVTSLMEYIPHKECTCIGKSMCNTYRVLGIGGWKDQIRYEIINTLHNNNYHIAGTFERENFREFYGSGAICESILHENGHCPLWFIAHNIQSVVNQRKIFCKILYFIDSWKFSPSKVSSYTVLLRTEGIFVGLNFDGSCYYCITEIICGSNFCETQSFPIGGMVYMDSHYYIYSHVYFWRKEVNHETWIIIPR